MLDCLKVESPIPVPIRRKLAESNCEPHCTEETPKQNGQSQTLDIEPIPFAVIKADGDESGITNTTIIIAVVSTSVVTFLLATLLFCWYTKSYSGVQNDEKPLLSLSTSEYSNGYFFYGKFLIIATHFILLTNIGNVHYFLLIITLFTHNNDMLTIFTNICNFYPIIATYLHILYIK